MAHDQTKLFLEAFNNIEVAISRLNQTPLKRPRNTASDSYVPRC
jgi:hypothetical protein